MINAFRLSNETSRSYVINSYSLSRVLRIRPSLIQVPLNAQLTVSGRSGGTGSHALYHVVVVFKRLVDHALTQGPRLEERTVKGRAYDLDHGLSYIINSYSLSRVLRIRHSLIQVLLNAQLPVSGRSGGTGSHALYHVVVVFKRLVDHALTQGPRLEEWIVKGTANDLDHAMQMDVPVNTTNKTIIPISSVDTKIMSKCFLSSLNLLSANVNTAKADIK